MKSKLLIVSIFVLCGEALSSGETSAATPDRGAIIAEVTNQAKAITDAQGHERRTSAQNCVKDGVPDDSPLWGDVLGDYNGLPVQDCSPTRSSPEAPGGKLTGRALLLLPTAEQAAEWIVSACEALNLRGDALLSCAKTVLAYVNGQNNLQFVIAGVIHEPKMEGFGKRDKASKACVASKDNEVLFSFRDGITVKLEGQDETSFRIKASDGCRATQPPDLSALLNAKVVYVASYGRVPGIPRAVYAACAGQKAPSDTEWRTIVRSGMAAAWSSPKYPLMEAVAKAIVRPSGHCKI
jgi:hypothetical protein